MFYIDTSTTPLGANMSFKNRAKEWDTEKRIKRAKIISDKILELVSNNKDKSIMEYGCATGLIGFNLKEKFKKLTLIDNELEMINIIKNKISTYKTTNIYPIKLDLTTEKYNKEKFDIIYTSLTLHHILNTKNIIKKFHDLLNENGILIIIDLDKEDGNFHINSPNFEGHNGFEHSYIENTMKEVGFKNIKSQIFYEDIKIFKENVIPYSLFYTIGIKNK